MREELYAKFVEGRKGDITEQCRQIVSKMFRFGKGAVDPRVDWLTKEVVVEWVLRLRGDG